MRENQNRSLLKAISWRITGSLDTILVSYLITGDVTVAASIGLLEVFTKILLYYLHERGWDKIKFGRELENNLDTKTTGD